MPYPELDRGLTWAVGDIKVTSIVEQDLWWKIVRFIPDATPELLDAHNWVQHYVSRDGERFPLRVQAFVVEAGDQTLVVDTCVGNDKPRGFPGFDHLSTPFLSDLAAAGFSPEAVDVVLCTHMHVDHVGWNTVLDDGRWRPTFPSARYLFAQVEYDHWSTETDDEAAVILGDSIQPVLDAGLAEFVELDHQVCDGVSLEPTTGHTPGHVSVRLESNGSHAVVTGDMIHHPIQLAEPSVCSTADVDSDAAAATRFVRFDEWCRDGVLVIGSHFAPPTVGYLASRGAGWELIDG